MRKNKKIRYAIIGCGRVSRNHLKAALNNNLDIVALCDIDLEKTEKLSSLFKLSEKIKKYQKYKEMIDSEKIDLIAISTDSDKHAEIALDCIKRKINLIIEKPIALSIKDADKIVEESKRQKVKVTVSHQNRFNKSVRKLKESIDQKRFGKLFHGAIHVRWFRSDEYYNESPWKKTKRQSGGGLMTLAIHGIDLLQWMMGGEIVEVFGISDNLKHKEIEIDDIGLAVLKFKNGSYGLIEGTSNIYPENLEETLYIFGESGTVKLGGKSVNRIDEWKFDDNIDKKSNIKKEYSEKPLNVYGFGHDPLYKDIIDSIINNKNPFVMPEDGRKAVALILSIYESAKKRKPIKIDNGI